MKVKQLLEKLRAFDPDIDMICFCEDEDIAPHGHGFRIFDIISTDLQEVEKTKGKDGAPSLKLGRTEHSVAHVLIEITSDF